MLPSISYRLSDTLAVGAGLMIDYAEMKARQKLPTAAFGRDTKLQMKGDDMGIGFTLGVVWRPWEGTAFGLGYRSRSTYELELDAKFYNIPPHDGGRPGHGHPLQGPRHHEVDVPQNVNFGVQQKITEKLTLMADITWTQWSIMKEMTTVFQRGPLVTKNTQVMKWHDSWRFSFGGEYKLSDKWTLRCGTAFDQRAVTKQENKTVMLPDSHRIWACVGASYQWNEHLRLDVGWNHIFFHRSHAIQKLSETQYIRGTYRGYTDLLSLGLKYES